MKNRLVEWSDKLLKRKRALIESVIEQLKNLAILRYDPASFYGALGSAPLNILVTVRLQILWLTYLLD